jgi:hypothetical protein
MTDVVNKILYKGKYKRDNWSHNKSSSGVGSLIGVGVGGMAGLGAMGAMGSLPGMPAQAKTLTPIVSSGVGLAATGEVANIGMGVAKGFGGGAKKRKHKKAKR